MGRWGAVSKDLIANIIQYWLWKAKVESAKDTSIHYTFKDFIDNPTIGESLSHWKIIRFADKLKDIVCILLGCTREQLEDRGIKSLSLQELADKGIISKEFVDLLDDD